MNKLIEALVRTDTPSAKADANFPAFTDALRLIRDRFIDDRVQGFMHPETGVRQEPVSREEAESRWQAVEPRFREVLLNLMNNPEDPSAARLGLQRTGQYPQSSDYRNDGRDEFVSPEMNPQDYDKDWERGSKPAGERAAQDEPSLRRGESRANSALKKLIG